MTTHMFSHVFPGENPFTWPMGLQLRSLQMCGPCWSSTKFGRCDRGVDTETVASFMMTMFYQFVVHWCSLMFIDVHWCSLMFIDVHWCSLMFVDVHWIRHHSVNHVLVCFRWIAISERHRNPPKESDGKHVEDQFREIIPTAIESIETYGIGVISLGELSPTFVDSLGFPGQSQPRDYFQILWLHPNFQYVFISYLFILI